MLSKGLVTSSVARTKPYLLTGWFPLREQFIYHVPKFPHMLEYITICTANKLHVGRFNFILYFALHNICNSVIDYEVFGKEILNLAVQFFIFHSHKYEPQKTILDMESGNQGIQGLLITIVFL